MRSTAFSGMKLIKCHLARFETSSPSQECHIHRDSVDFACVNSDFKKKRFLPSTSKVWGKVIFSEACVSHSVHRDVCGRGDAWWGGSCVAGGMHPREMANEVGGMHPTGMHSCFKRFWFLK